MGEAPVRIAMWSGPRNVSTALMRAFGSRPDTVVSDEPLYAFYLAATGAPHPGAAEVVRECESDWRTVADTLVGPVPGGKPVWYQKHMAHHLLPGVGREWLAALTHAFLIRDPREMLLSLSKVVPKPAVEDTGLPQQWELYEATHRRTGRRPPVVDAKDVLTDPLRVLSELCVALGLAFDPAMLSWEPGPRQTDGVWARHWYAATLRSSGFEPWRPRAGELPAALVPVHQGCREPYERLHEHRIRA